MAFAGNTGLIIRVPDYVPDHISNLFLLNEQIGVIIQINNINMFHICKKFQNKNIRILKIGEPIDENKIVIQKSKENKNSVAVLYKQEMTVLRDKWESTSRKLELLQCNSNCVEQEYESYKEYGNRPNYNLPKIVQHKFSQLTRIKELSIPKTVGILREEGTNSERELAAAFYHAGYYVVDINTNDLLQNNQYLDNINVLAFAGGFSFADIFGSANGWAQVIQQNKTIKDQFDRFYKRENTFSIGICNGCQLMARLGWIDSVDNLVLEENISERFESRWCTLRVNSTNNVFLKDLKDTQFGMWVAHKEGRFTYTTSNNSFIPPIQYVDFDGQPTQKYPENPNNSYLATAALSSKNGRHLAIMSHPERSFLQYQVPYDKGLCKKNNNIYSPWFLIFTNIISAF